MTSTTHIAHTLLSQAHPPATASAIFTEKVLHKPLHLRPTSPDPASHDARTTRHLQRVHKKEKSQRRKKVKPLSAKEKRMSGIYDLPDEAKKYAIYVPLHRMWTKYMWEVLGMKEGEKTFLSAQGAGSKLTSADFHGAELTVVRSRCVGLVGLEGIVVKDTKFTFQIITKKNELKTIPKRHTVFCFKIPQATRGQDVTDGQAEKTADDMCAHLPNLVFEIHGSQFENRATDRATKKFKQRNMSDL